MIQRCEGPSRRLRRATAASNLETEVFYDGTATGPDFDSDSFLQGALSFFSPCVFAVVPLYLGYLAAGAKEKSGRRKKDSDQYPLLCAGISFAFFLLGLGFSAVGRFFSGNRALFARLGGILVILLGVYQLGSSDPPRPSRRSGACRCGLTVWRWARCRRCCWDSSSALHGHPVSDLR